MLEAIVDRVGARVDLSAPPPLLDYSVRARLGMYQTLHLHRFPRTSAQLGGYIPAELRRRYGLIADDEITGVLDASGFAYSDSFGVKRSKREALYGQRWKRRGVPKVMLPQAFGPFVEEGVARWAAEVLNQADLVFVRDRTSEKHLAQLNIKIPVKVAPDFTIGLAPLEVPVPVEGSYVAIVPNMKLVTQGVLTETDYVTHLVQLGKAAVAHGLSPLVVIHETADRKLGAQIAARLSAQTFDDPRPRALKGAIAGSSLLIASRFHAIVGGLSQSVQTIAIGWSHKYGELLSDFGVPDWSGGLDQDPSEIVTRVLNDDDGVSRLREAKRSLVAQTDEMWKLTEEALSLPAAH